MTTMALGTTERFGDAGRCPVRGTVVHGSILLGLTFGMLALWSTLALVAALLASPVPTMITLEREGAWGLPDVVRHGSTVLVSLRPVARGRSTR